MPGFSTEHTKWRRRSPGLHFTPVPSPGFPTSRSLSHLPQIGIGAVIKGWDEGVMGMSLGEKAVLNVSSDFGYGERGASTVIPPNADLKFEVELLAIGGTFAPGYGGGATCSQCALQ